MLSVGNDSRRRMDSLIQQFRDSGIKLTPQRIEIFREVARLDDHPDAETIYRRVHRRVPTLSRDTVYRTLWALLDLGLIETLGPPRKTVRFDANMNDHHHLICARCGMVQDFVDAKLSQLQICDSGSVLKRIERVQVEVRGVCTKCAESEQEESK